MANLIINGSAFQLENRSNQVQIRRAYTHQNAGNKALTFTENFTITVNVILLAALQPIVFSYGSSPLCCCIAGFSRAFATTDHTPSSNPTVTQPYNKSFTTAEGV